MYRRVSEAMQVRSGRGGEGSGRERQEVRVMQEKAGQERLEVELQCSGMLQVIAVCTCACIVCCVCMCVWVRVGVCTPGRPALKVTKSHSGQNGILHRVRHRGATPPTVPIPPAPVRDDG